MGGQRKMGILKLSCLVVAFHLLAMSLAKAEDRFQNRSCTELKKDLKDMQQAQHQLFSSFEQKSESLAVTLDQHAQNLIKAQGKNGKLKKTDFQGLTRSADALRKHQTKENDLISRFEKATALLLDQVQSCLEKNSSISSHKSVADDSAKN